MSNRIIRCAVENEFIRGGGVVIGAAGSHDDVELELSFSPMWDGTSKKIVWFDALNEQAVVTALTTDLLVEGEDNLYRVPVPWEAKAVEGDMKLTIRGANVTGTTETRAVVAATVCFRVLPAIWDPLAVEGSEPSASVSDQLQQEIEDIKGDIVDAAKAADALEQTEAARDAAQASAVAAANNALNAAASANEAGVYADKAGAYADKAEAERQAIENMTVSSATLPAESDATATKSETTGGFNIHFGIPRGPRGFNGVAVAADGQYAFNVDGNGHLILIYTGDEAPDFVINENGHLILNV